MDLTYKFKHEKELHKNKIEQLQSFPERHQ
jgi:hypothetical protein